MIGGNIPPFLLFWKHITFNILGLRFFSPRWKNINWVEYLHLVPVYGEGFLKYSL